MLDNEEACVLMLCLLFFGSNTRDLLIIWKAIRTFLRTRVEYVSNDVCNTAYGEVDVMTDNIMCAARSGIDICGQDIGGPIVKKGAESSDHVQVGVGSVDYCALPRYRGIYARVSEKKSWIEDVMNNQSSSSNSWAVAKIYQIMFQWDLFN